MFEKNLNLLTYKKVFFVKHNNSIWNINKGYKL